MTVRLAVTAENRETHLRPLPRGVPLHQSQAAKVISVDPNLLKEVQATLGAGK